MSDFTPEQQAAWDRTFGPAGSSSLGEAMQQGLAAIQRGEHIKRKNADPLTQGPMFYVANPYSRADRRVAVEFARMGYQIKWAVPLDAGAHEEV
jgi:hypothetical protein